MNYLGATRTVSQDFKAHKTAEDYAGSFKSNVKIYGTMKVTRIVKKFKVHEDSINYNDYLNNKSKWKEGNYYNCISITGKKVKMHVSELGGNQIALEGYVEGKKVKYLLCHLAEVYVSVGDIVDGSTLLASQGNTGLVLSSKARTDETYGTHVHLEVTNANGTYINPREYALGNIKPMYQEQSNELDEKKEQLRVKVDKINLREKPSTSSKIIGGVYEGEIYTILNKSEDSLYTWYQIKTSRGLEGYIASKKDEDWIELLQEKEIVPEEVEPEQETYQLLYQCQKSDTYAIYLNEGEELYLKKIS